MLQRLRKTRKTRTFVLNPHNVLVVVLYHSRWVYIGLLRPSTYLRHWSAHSSGISGNMKGDGSLLGSTLVVGSQDQGILYEHRSRVFGDRADPQQVLDAVKKIKTKSKTVIFF